MHDFFHSRTVIITQPISITHISLVYAVEVNFVLCKSMLKYAINRPISTLGLKPIWSISLSRDDNSPDMENGMH